MLCFYSFSCHAQMVPSEEENIPFLVTFGKDAQLKYGDDDFSQTFFFKVPKDHKLPFFIRIFDPETGGANDEIVGTANSTTQFSLYGGSGAYSHPDSKSLNPVGQYKKGNLVFTISFGSTSSADNGWYTMGPFNPSEGEFISELDAYVFKLIAEGTSGDDGNLYRYFLSSSPAQNQAIENGNAFTFEYSIRLHDDPKKVSHIYPFVNDQVISLKQHNYDWDSDGKIVIYSVSKVAEVAKTGGDSEWGISLHKVTDDERGSCMNFQMIKDPKGGFENNNVVFYVTNQYGKLLPFYSVPIGVYTPSNKKIKIE